MVRHIPPYSTVFVPQRGFGRGSELGFPTANTDADDVPLPDGVYTCDVQISSPSSTPADSDRGVLRPGLASIGSNETFAQTNRVLEVYILDLTPARPLYDSTLHVTLHAFLRPQTKFESAQALVAQMRDDEEQRRRITTDFCRCRIATGPCNKEDSPRVNEAVMVTGGKDSVVLLDVLAEQRGHLDGAIVVAFWTTGSQCPHQMQVLSLCEARWNFRVRHIHGESYCACLQEVSRLFPSLRILHMGTRSTDGSPRRDVTDTDWPFYWLRYPIWDFSYRDVWSRIHARNLPFCTLYTQGYTSLGQTEQTSSVNEHLRRPDGSWAPAWELEDVATERRGR